MSKREQIKQKRQDTPNWSKIFTSKSFDIIDAITNAMKNKVIEKQELADKLNVSLEKLNSMLLPNYNFTLKEIAKIEDALGVSILNTNARFIKILNEI